jgi:hypothetical protein
MKKFILNIVFFIVAVKALDLVGYYTLNYFYSRTYAGQDGGDINKYLQDKHHPELVIMGSSTARFQVCPDSFPIKSCNMARAMTEDSYQLGLLMLMIKKGQAPKNILLSVWPYNYIQTGKEDKQPEDILFLKYYYNQVPFIKNEIDKITYFEKYKYLLASNKFNGRVTDIFKYWNITRRQTDSNYFFRYQASTPEDSINIRNIEKIKAAAAATEPATLSAIHTQYLGAIADTCKKYGINLMCYYMPMLQTDTVKIAHAMQFIRNTMAAKQIPYLEIGPQTAPEIFNRISWWTDGLHVNEKGGAVQSALLSKFAAQYLKH